MDYDKILKLEEIVKKLIEDKDSLSKGEKGDWKAENYTFTHETETDERFTPGIIDHKIKAFDSKGNLAGKYHFSEKSHPKSGNEKMPELYAASLQTHKNHQRKGLASAAHDLIESKVGKKVQTSPILTSQGKKFYSNKEQKIEKGERGDWRAEGYSIRQTESDHEDSHRFEMIHPKFGKVGSAEFHKESNEPTGTYVHPDHQRKGIATALYQYAEKVTGKPIREDRIVQNAQSRKLWSQPNRPFGKGEELAKGERGDWRKEGYKLKHHDDAEGDHVITAHHKGKQVGVAIFNRYGDNLESDHTEVHKDHRRKGIASAMYQLAEKKSGLKVKPAGNSQTPDAKKLWSQPNRPFGKGEGISSPLKNAVLGLKKTLTAGSGNAAPSTLTGGAALQVEEISNDLQKPFKSKAQRKFLYSNPEKVGGKKKLKEWEEKTPKNIPEKVSKSEFDESWFFLDDDELTKSAPPEEEGVSHPSQPWVSKRHPNGRMMWHGSQEQSKRIDQDISDKSKHQKIMSSLPETHHQAYANMVRQTVKDPNRHFIPTEEQGKQKLRARHLKSLLSGNPSVKLDASHPDRLTLHRKSHSQGDNIDKTISIHFPTRSEK